MKKVDFFGKTTCIDNRTSHKVKIEAQTLSFFQNVGGLLYEVTEKL